MPNLLLGVCTYTSMAYMHYRYGARSHHLDIAMQKVVGSEGLGFCSRSVDFRASLSGTKLQRKVEHLPPSHIAEKDPTLHELIVRVFYERSGLFADHPVMSSTLSIDGGWPLFLE
jgi:hypothetical protein